MHYLWLSPKMCYNTLNICGLHYLYLRWRKAAPRQYCCLIVVPLKKKACLFLRISNPRCARVVNYCSSILLWSELPNEFRAIICLAFFVAFIVVNFLVFFFSKKSILFCIALGLHYLCTSKATGKRVQKKFTYFAEREWFRETEPPGIECKRSLLVLPSVSGFVKTEPLVWTPQKII